MKFVHAADIHLDSPLKGLEAYEGAPVDQIRGATRTAFEALVELCLDEEADFLVVAGDLYDGDWQDFNTGLYFARQMMRLNQADIPVFVLHGNHDAQSRITRQLRLPENVHVFPAGQPETRTLEDLGVALHGQSFSTQHVTENLAAGYPPPVTGLFNIGVLHTALEGHQDHATYAPCSLAELCSQGYDYWALGHVHHHEVLANEPHVVFPGNLQGRHILETGPKGCCVVDVEDGRVHSVTHRPLDVVRWVRLDVEVKDAENFEKVVQAVGEPLAAELAKVEPRTLAVRLSLAGETDLHPMLVQRAEELTNQLRALATEVGGGAIYLEKVQLATRAPDRRAPPTESLTDALDLITAEAERLRTDADGRELILSQVRPLLERLPASLKLRSDHLSLEQPEQLEELLHGAQALALARLWPPNEGG